jgi:hypothetical protein
MDNPSNCREFRGYIAECRDWIGMSNRVGFESRVRCLEDTLQYQEDRSLLAE